MQKCCLFAHTDSLPSGLLPSVLPSCLPSDLLFCLPFSLPSGLLPSLLPLLPPLPASPLASPPASGSGSRRLHRAQRCPGLPICSRLGLQLTDLAPDPPPRWVARVPISPGAQGPPPERSRSRSCFRHRHCGTGSTAPSFGLTLEPGPHAEGRRGRRAVRRDLTLSQELMHMEACREGSIYLPGGRGDGLPGPWAVAGHSCRQLPSSSILGILEAPGLRPHFLNPVARPHPMLPRPCS